LHLMLYLQLCVNHDDHDLAKYVKAATQQTIIILSQFTTNNQSK